jgi:glycosyltransferase involved in cell wall biosynthesis
VVVPIYNEAANLAALVDEVQQAVGGLGLDWELILVDDGSRDDTAQALPALCGSQVRGIRLEQNSGQSTALLVGLRASRYDTVATMDGDLQNDPKDLPNLLRHLEGADMVCGQRQRRRDTPWRRVVSRVANRLRSSLTGDGISDTGCSLKVMTGAVADQMVFFRGAHRFMPALAQLEGFRVAEVPVSHRPRAAGQTKYGNWQRLKATVPDLLGFLWLKSRYAEYRAEEV